MEKKAIFAGSFDPFTVGHEDIVRRALHLFDHVIIGVGYNIKKKGFLPMENRVRLIRDTFRDEPRVSAEAYLPNSKPATSLTLLSRMISFVFSSHAAY